MAISRTFNDSVWHTKARGSVTYADWQSHLQQQGGPGSSANVFTEFFDMDGVGEIALSPVEIDRLAAHAAGIYRKFAHAEVVMFTTRNAPYIAASDLKTEIVKRCRSIRFRIVNAQDEFDQTRDIYVKSSQFAWREELSVGHNAIDRQHQRLLGLVRGLESEVLVNQQAGVAREELQWHLGELVDYALEHFGMEQSLLEKHGYPQATSHSREHLKLSGELLRLQGRLRDSNASILSAEILAFFRGWVVTHILSSDIQAFTWIKQNSPIWRFENRAY
ncbi:bacteriohemerythrin [Sedimenticola sp.]|uniref:bacteriohemerythrin n=1 Tax=Sedimenticola sp. TaxID=1940285 RepID=UPI003D0D38FC